MNKEQKDGSWNSGEFCPYCMGGVRPGKPCPACGLTQSSYTPAPHHLPPGTVLMDRYLIGRALGEGGFGITYIGRDLRLEVKVAIKEYFPSGLAARDAAASMDVHACMGRGNPGYEQGLSRFLFEARTMARMEKQPQIVMVRDYFEANNTAYIVMEYVEGTNFIDLAARRGGRIPASELFPLIEPLFTALSAMHKAGLIHRDISPDNLMLEQGSVRLLDFGCARESSRGTDSTMAVALKQGYAPIEQYQCMGQGPWTDVYALSATIYFCLTGRVPPKSLDRLLSDELAAPMALGVDITPEQQRALLRGMEINPEKRCQTVDELYSGLYCTEDASAGRGIHPRDVESAADAQAPAAKRRVSGRIAALLCALAFIAALALLIPGQHEAGTSQPQELASFKHDELFEDAVTVSSDTELAFALADSTVAAVILEGSGANVGLPGTVTELDKPLLISEGARLVMPGALILREGGVLWTAGELADDGTVVAAGGSLVTVDGASLNASVYLLSGGGLLQDGGSVNGEVHDMRLAGGEAVTVSTFDDLKAASGDAGALAIVIEGSIALSETLTFERPLVVSEGASLSAASGAEIQMNGAPLVNCGSVDAGIWCGGEGSLLLNCGSIEAAGQLWVESANEDDAAWTLMNFGELSLTAYSAAWCDILNFGTLDVGTAEGSGDQTLFGFGERSFLNFGSVRLGEGAAFQMGGTLRNMGGISVSGDMDLTGRVVSRGAIEVLSGGELCNSGLLDMYDGSSLEIAAGGEFDTTEGIFLYRNLYAVVDGDIDGTAWCVDFTPIDVGAAQAYASTEAELLAAMDEGGAEAVVVDGDLSLTRPLTVTKPLYVSGHLALPEGAQLTVDGTIFCVNGELTCDSVAVQNGAMAEFICAWRGTDGAASLSVSGGSWVYTRDGDLELESIELTGASMLVYDSIQSALLSSVTVSDSSYLAIAGTGVTDAALDIRASGAHIIQLSALQAGSIALSGSVYSQAGSLSLGGGSVLSIDACSFFRSEGAMLEIAQGASVLNCGSFTAGGFSDMRGVWVHGTFTNSGELYIGQPVHVLGLLDNLGRIYSDFDEERAIVLGPDGMVAGGADVLPRS